MFIFIENVNVSFLHSSILTMCRTCLTWSHITDRILSRLFYMPQSRARPVTRSIWHKIAFNGDVDDDTTIIHVLLIRSFIHSFTLFFLLNFGSAQTTLDYVFFRRNVPRIFRGNIIVCDLVLNLTHSWIDERPFFTSEPCNKFFAFI